MPNRGPAATATSLVAEPRENPKGFAEIVDNVAAPDLRAQRGEPVDGQRRPVPVRAVPAGAGEAGVRARHGDTHLTVRNCRCRVIHSNMRSDEAGGAVDPSRPRSPPC